MQDLCSSFITSPMAQVLSGLAAMIDLGLLALLFWAILHAHKTRKAARVRLGLDRGEAPTGTTA